MTTGTANGAVPQETSERAALLEEIEQTREELGDTVEALSHKVDVKAQVHERVEERKGQLHRTGDEVANKLRTVLERPAIPAAVVAVAGLLLLVSWRRRR